MEGRHLFPRDIGLLYRLWGSVFGRSRETCYVTEFSQPLILSCTPSSSIRGSVVSSGHVCHNLLGMAHSRYWRRGQKINKLDWAARPRGRSPYPGLCGSGSTLLHQISLFTAVWTIKLNFIKRSQQKGKIYSIRLLYSAGSPFVLQTNMQSHIVNVQEGLLFAFDFIKSKHHLSYHSSRLYSPRESIASLLFIIKYRFTLHGVGKKFELLQICVTRQMCVHVFLFWSCAFLVCSYQPCAEGTERNSERNQGQWLLDNRSICEVLSFHYLPTSIATAVFFLTPFP